MLSIEHKKRLFLFKTTLILTSLIRVQMTGPYQKANVIKVPKLAALDEGYLRPKRGKYGHKCMPVSQSKA